MADDTTKPWKKTEDIPRRFDELPPEPGWVPVADVIRNSREDEARQEKKKEKFKIKPPADSDSEGDGKGGNRGDVRKPEHKEKRRTHTPSKKPVDTSMPPSVDDVTQAMVEWALNPNHYKRKPKPARHDQIRPPPGTPTSSPLLQGKTRTKERQIGKLPTVAPRDDSRITPPRRAETRADVPRSSSGQKPHNPSGAVRRSPQHPTSNRKDQHLPYDEPTPDYDDDNDKYYSRYDVQYYREGHADEDFYYQDRYGYEDSEAVEPYPYDSAYDKYQEYQPYPHQEYQPYPQQEYQPYPPQESYGNPYTDHYGAPGYDYREPEYSYEAQRSPYQQPSPYYRSERQPRSSHDVLY